MRSKIPPHKSQEEADAEVKKMEEEMVKVISGKAPELASLFKNSTSGRDSSPQGGLGAISEEMEDMDDLDEVDEDFDEDLDEDMDDDDEDDSSKRWIFNWYFPYETLIVKRVWHKLKFLPRP